MQFLPALIAFFFLACTAFAGGALPGDVRQLLVGIAPDWNSSSGKLTGFQRGPDGRWKATLSPASVLLGKNGLAWCRGVVGSGEPGLQKTEHDKRAPAGVFKIGKIYTSDSTLPSGADYPFHTITTADAWVDDPALPQYNQFVTVDPKNLPPWFSKQRMRQNDFAYRWLVEIRHNSDPPVPGCGSAIFMHIRRGVTRPTFGCTSMAEANLVALIRWLHAAENPHYALLPKAEYERRWKPWGLPAPSEFPQPKSSPKSASTAP